MDPRNKQDVEERVPDTDPAPPPSMGAPDSRPSLQELFKSGNVVVTEDDGEYG